MIGSSSRDLIRDHQTSVRLFLIVGAVVLLAALIFSLRFAQASAPAASHTSRTSSLNLHTNQVTPSASDAFVNSSSSSKSSNLSSEGSSTSVTSRSTSDGEGSVTTHMTVNGQPVNVPANGSIQQTVTSPDGSTTTINATSSQSNTGTGTNSNHLHTYTSFHSSTHVTQQGDATP